MFQRALLSLTLLTSFGALLGGCPTSSPSGPPCDVDTDCEDGWYCEGGGVGCTFECVVDLDCTGGETCDEARGRCNGTTVDAGPRDAGPRDAPRSDAPSDCTDPDHDDDGDDAIGCGGDDCDDEDENRSSLNEEESDDFNRDEDCNPCTVGEPNVADADDDGFFSDEACNTVDERPSDDACPGFDPSRPTLRIVSDTLVCGTDCDDRGSGVFPGATDSCDGEDNDCDGETDEDELETFYRDADGDGAGDPAMSMQSCVQPLNYVANTDDCNDSNPRIRGLVISGSEGSDDAAACDGLDNDCDLAVDEGDPGGGGSCYNPGRPGTPCVGTNRCMGARIVCVQNDPSFPRDGAEDSIGECNGVDDNCDGTVDSFSLPCSNSCPGGSPGTQTCTSGIPSTCSFATVTGIRCSGPQCGTGVQSCTGGAYTDCAITHPGFGRVGTLCAGASNWGCTEPCTGSGYYSGTCTGVIESRDFSGSAAWLHDRGDSVGWADGGAWYVPETSGTGVAMDFGGLPAGSYRVIVHGHSTGSIWGHDGVWVDVPGYYDNYHINGSFTLEMNDYHVDGCGDTSNYVYYRGDYGWQNLWIDSVWIHKNS